MRKNFLLFLLCVLPFAVSAQNANVKLGYVDVQTLFYSMPETVEADSAIQKSARMHEAEVKKMEDKYWCCGGKCWLDKQPAECDSMNCEDCEYYVEEED
jgi:hypothetical protein